MEWVLRMEHDFTARKPSEVEDEVPDFGMEEFVPENGTAVMAEAGPPGQIGGSFQQSKAFQD